MKIEDKEYLIASLNLVSADTRKGKLDGGTRKDLSKLEKHVKRHPRDERAKNYLSRVKDSL